MLLRDQTGRPKRPDHPSQSALLSDTAAHTRDPHTATVQGRGGRTPRSLLLTPTRLPPGASPRGPRGAPGAAVLPPRRAEEADGEAEEQQAAKDPPLPRAVGRACACGRPPRPRRALKAHPEAAPRPRRRTSSGAPSGGWRPPGRRARFAFLPPRYLSGPRGEAEEDLLVAAGHQLHRRRRRAGPCLPALGLSSAVPAGPRRAAGGRRRSEGRGAAAGRGVGPGGAEPRSQARRGAARERVLAGRKRGARGSRWRRGRREALVRARGGRAGLGGRGASGRATPGREKRHLPRPGASGLRRRGPRVRGVEAAAVRLRRPAAAGGAVRYRCAHPPHARRAFSLCFCFVALFIAARRSSKRAAGPRCQAAAAEDLGRAGRTRHRAERPGRRVTARHGGKQPPPLPLCGVGREGRLGPALLRQRSRRVYR